MSTDEKDIKEFFKDLTISFEGEDSVRSVSLSVNDPLLNNKECYYIFDLTLGNIIHNHGFEKVLGYPDQIVSYDLLLEKYHPEDIDTVLRISKATISHCTIKPFECKDSLLQISYRFMNNDGNYVKILSQSSAHTTNKEGFMTSIFVKMTDISFLENTNYVNWHFNAKNLDNKAFKNQVYSAYKDFFTKREKDIILEISQGNTTKEIASKLNVSQHTIATHRKNILKKANRHNIEDLILFCKRKGIL